MCASGLASGQTPAGTTATNAVADCPRGDFTAINEWLATVSKAVDEGTPEIAAQAQQRIRRCMKFQVSFRSTVTIKSGVPSGAQAASPFRSIGAAAAAAGADAAASAAAAATDAAASAAAAATDAAASAAALAAVAGAALPLANAVPAIRSADYLKQTVTGMGMVTLDLSPGMLQDAGYDFASHPEMIRAPIVWSNVAITGGACSDYRIVPSPPTKFAFWLGVDTRAQPKAALVVAPDGAETHLVEAKCQGHWGWPTPMPIFTPGWIALYSRDPGSDDEFFKIEMPGASGRAIFAQGVIRRTVELPNKQGSVDESTEIVITHAPSAR
jgi:hypothetical protein